MNESVKNHETCTKFKLNTVCIFFLKIINNNKYKLYICIPSKVREQN